MQLRGKGGGVSRARRAAPGMLTKPAGMLTKPAGMLTKAAYRARAALLQDKETRLAALAKQMEKDRASGLSLQVC